MKHYILLISSLLTTPLAAAETCWPSEIYVTRHAEKQQAQGERDPNLSIKGKQRAERLANKLSSTEISGLYASGYKRTEQTLIPLSQQKKLTIQQYDPRNQQALVDQLIKNYCEKSVVIAGHSNTVPELLTLMGATFEVSIGQYMFQKAPVVWLPENEYSLLFKVSFTQGNRTPKIEVINTDLNS